MAFLDVFRAPISSRVPQIQSGIVGPNTPAHNLKHIVLADILGNDEWLPVTRSSAIQIPAVAKARALICGTIARVPLRAYRDGVPLENQPTWLSRSDSSLPPQHRMAWIADDLLFGGASLLYVERGAAGQIIDAVRVDPTYWSIDPDSGGILINGDSVDADKVLYIPSLGDGLLTAGASTLRAAADLERTRAARLRSPNPTTQIKLTSDAEFTQDEIDDTLADWADARNSPTGAVALVPYGIDVINDGATGTDLFIEATNSIAVQIAQLTHVPATLLEASVAAGASLNYQNMASSRSWWIDTSLAYWLTAIEARLSMDDVTPRGTYLQFDLSNLIETPMPATGPVLDD